MVLEPSEGERGVAAGHILKVAARLFAGQGYDATPVRTIAEAAGVTKPTLYYHFGSKEGLAQALLTEPVTGLVVAMRAEVEAPGDPVRRLERLAELHFEFCRTNPDRVRFFYALFFGPMGGKLAAELGRHGCEFERLIEIAVGRAVEAGMVDGDRAAGFATAFRSLIVTSMMDFLYHDVKLGPDLAGRLVGDLLRGFGGAGYGERQANERA